MESTEYDPADTDCVVSAANYLEESEFKIFSDAYMTWYGKAASEKQMERVFTEYLLENKVPFWVRNYARSRIEGFAATNEKENARLANNMLYIATVIAEYVLLGCYIVMR